MWPDELYRIMCSEAYIDVMSAIADYDFHKSVNRYENTNIPYTPIHQALQLRRLDVVEKIIQNNPESIYMVDHESYSTLHTICIIPNVMNIVIALDLECDFVLDIKYASMVLNKHKLDEACIHILKEEISGNEKSYDDIDKSIEYMKSVKERIQQDELLIAEMLLERGADVNARDTGFRTPIHYAARYGNTKMVNLLLDYGADVNFKAVDGITVLEYAVDSKNIETIKAIIDNRSNINKKDSSLLKAISNKDLEASLFLYDYGFSVNSVDIRYKNTSLHYATQAHSLSILVPKLLQRGADVNAKNIKGESPLHLMARNSYDIENIKMLIAFGADVNAIDRIHSTPLHQASTLEGCRDIAITLIESGAYVNARDCYNKTPIHYAAVRNNVAIINTLLDYGADIEAISNNIGTALHFAVRSSHTYATVKTLIDRGANINSRNKNLSTPLHYACEKRCGLDVIKILIDNGADLNATNRWDQYPLLIAIGYPSLVNTLLYYGAEPINNRVLDKNLNDDMFSFRYIIAHICIQDFIRTNVKNKLSLQNNIKSLKEIIHTDNTFKRIWLSCMEELKTISRISINMFYSLDIFITSKNMNLLHHLVNNPIVKETNAHSFYNYGFRLSTSISLAANRHQILEKSRSKLDEILYTSYWSRLPPDIKLYILEFIENNKLSDIYGE
ncbi:ankyrin repeat containing protein [Finch poxvirus]|uniref:Ankyrin repeat containing protein n=2 Tax=unclassified Avipoxvirus TaxID=336487 RepID=A0AAT9UQW6_9POXV|nr:ankyrin repeat containing protein [Finch poxvirus]UOX39059.1 ankyrin repeat containing protein [Finch poxvirus]